MKVHRPHWARLSHPVTRYLWKKTTFRGKRWLYGLALLLSLAMLVSMLVITYRLYAADELDSLLIGSENAVYVTLYPLLLLMQMSVTLGAFAQTMLVHLTAPRTTQDERQHAWELVKATSHGAELVTRGRWAVVIGRMGVGMIVIVAARLLFVGLILANSLRESDEWRAALAAAYPALPETPAVLLIGLLLAGLLLLPVSAVIFSVAAGILFSAAIYRLWLIGLIQRAVVLGGMGGALICLLTGWSVIETPSAFETGWPAEFAALAAMVLAGDLGLRLLSEPVLRQVIAQVDYSLWLGLPVIALVLLQILLARWLLALAARVAARPGRI